MKKVRLYLSNTNAVTYPVVRRALTPMLSKIEYTYNPKANDLIIDCQHLTKERMLTAKKDLLNDVEMKYKQLNNLR